MALTRNKSKSQVRTEIAAVSKSELKEGVVNIPDDEQTSLSVIQKVRNVRSRRCFPLGQYLENDTSDRDSHSQVYTRKVDSYKKKKVKLLAGLPLLSSLISSEDDLSNDSVKIESNPQKENTIIPDDCINLDDDLDLDFGYVTIVQPGDDFAGMSNRS